MKCRLFMIADKVINLNKMTYWMVVNVTDDEYGIRVFFENGSCVDFVTGIESEELACKLSEVIFAEIDEEDDTYISAIELERVINQLKSGVSVDDVDFYNDKEEVNVSGDSEQESRTRFLRRRNY